MHDPQNDDAEFEVRAAGFEKFLATSVSGAERGRLLSILRDLQTEMHQCNPYVQLYRHLAAVEHEAEPLKLALSERDLPADSTRRYTAHNSPEVAVLCSDDPGYNDLAIHLHGGQVQKVSCTHRAADPLYFALLHPRGHPGWRDGLTRELRGSGKAKRLTPAHPGCR